MASRLSVTRGRFQWSLYSREIVQLVRCPESRVAARGRFLIHYNIAIVRAMAVVRGVPLVGGSVMGGSIVLLSSHCNVSLARVIITCTQIKAWSPQ